MPRLPHGHPDDAVAINGHRHIDSGTLESGTGEKMDLDLAVDALVQINRTSPDTTRT